MTPASIRPSANSAASLSSSSRPAPSAQTGRTPREKETASGLDEFGSYVAMWMETRPDLLTATPRQLAGPAPLRPPVRTTEEHARRSRFEPSSTLSDASENRRRIAENRTEGIARSRTGIADSRPRADAADARALVRGNAPMRPESHVPARRSASQPARTEMADASPRNADSPPASDASRDSRAAARDSSRPAQRRATQEWAASEGDAAQRANRPANGRDLAEAAEANPRAQEPGGQENSDPPVLSTGPASDPTATGVPASTPGHSIPAEVSPGQAISASGNTIPSQGSGAGPQTADPRMDSPSGTGTSGPLARFGTAATAGMAGHAGLGGSLVPVPVGSDAATAASGSSPFAADFGRSGAGTSSPLPTIRITVDQIVASAAVSDGKVANAVENARLTTEGAVGGTTDSTMDDTANGSVEMTGSRWASTKNGDAVSSPPTARPFAMGIHAESNREPALGAAMKSHAVPGSRDAARTLERTTLAPSGQAPSSEASLATAENNANVPLPARARADASLPIPGSAVPAAPRFRPGGSSVEGVRSGKEASRRMTIPDTASSDATAASNPEASAPDASGESSPWLPKPSRAGAAGMAAHPEFHPASPAAASSGHASSSVHLGAGGAAQGTIRTGAHSSHSQSGGTLPKVAEALLAELPPQPGSASGKDLPAARSLRVDVPGVGGGEDVRLRFLQRGNRAAGSAGADIEVRIESQSERFVREMRTEIPSLLHRLERSGFDAGSAVSGQRMTDHGEQRDASSHRHGGGSSGQLGGDGFAEGRSPEQGGGEENRQAFSARAVSRRGNASSFAGSLSSAIAGRAEAFRDDALGSGWGEGRGNS